MRVQLGARDYSGRFQIPQKLYGREQEIERLIHAFERVSQTESKSLDLLEVKSKDLDSTSALITIAGYSGVGKTALVYELHKPITARRGHFIQGKFDQFQRNIPYSAILQAFEEFVKLILTKSPTELQAWRAHLQQAAGNIGKVLTDLLPSLELIIGKQPDVPTLDGVAAMNRFNYALRNLVRAMATPPLPLPFKGEGQGEGSTFKGEGQGEGSTFKGEGSTFKGEGLGGESSAGQGLVVFIDDWQWADFPSINLLELWLTDPTIRHLMVIAAYRDNEVDGAHPLMLAVENLKKVEVVVESIAVQNLSFDHVHALIAEALRGIQEASQVFETCEALARLVYEKTQGNAFFVGQFLQRLYEEELLNFNFEQFAWQWDMGQIRAKGITDNVVDLLTQKVQKLAPETQRILQLAACLGNKFTLSNLALVAEHDVQKANQVLEPAVLEGLIVPSHAQFQQADLAELSYHFAHDRVQQAAYSLLDEAEKQRTHVQIGRLLLGSHQISSVEELARPRANSDPRGRGSLLANMELHEQLFDITNHWNKGLAVVTDAAERVMVARLNLWAGHKAKNATAYKPALMYYQTGLELLPESRWQSDYELTLALYAGLAEAAYLSSDFEQAMSLIQTALIQAKTILAKVPFYIVQIKVHTAQGQPLLAMDTGWLAFKQLGLTVPRQPSQLQVGQALLHTRWLLRNKTPADLLALPPMTNPHSLAILQVAHAAGTSAYVSSPNLFALVVLMNVKLVVQQGITPVAAGAYIVAYGMIMVGVVGDIPQGYQWGQLALQLADQTDAQATAIYSFNTLIKPWQAHLRESLSELRRGYQVGLERGDLVFAAWCVNMSLFFLYLSGEPLAKIEVHYGVAQVQVTQLHQQRILNRLYLDWQVILNWRGEARQPWQLTGTKYDEVSHLPQLLAQDAKGDLALLYYHKLTLAYYFQNYLLALEYARQGQLNLAAIMASQTKAFFYFYDSLTHLALYPTASKVQQLKWRFRVWQNQRKMKHWAHHAPMNYLHKYYLVEAELARVLGQIGAAGEYYDKAIVLAKEHGYLQEEALAYELASQCYRAQNRLELADYYLRQSYRTYQQWGATAKVTWLEERYPFLKPPPSPAPVMTTTTHSTSGLITTHNLDLATLFKATQTLSGEIKLDNLLEKMMTLVMQNAGAQRGLLILRDGEQWFLQAEAGSREYEVGGREGEIDYSLLPTPDSLNVLQAIPLEMIGGKSDTPKLSLTMMRYAEQTQAPLVLDDARTSAQFAQTVYVQKYQPKSVLCLPLIHQGQLVGGIYLENNLVTGAFTPERLEMLKLLSSQMAISLENAQLYHQLEQRVLARTAELQAANQQLAHLNADKDKFFSIIAHDLKGPFTPVLGNAKTLVEQANHLPRPEIKTLGETLLRSAQNTFGLLENLLHWARLQMGRMDFQPKALNLREVLQQTVNLLHGTAENKGISLTSLLQAEVMVQADENMLATIVRNLTNNALKFTPRGGQVRLSAKGLGMRNQELVNPNAEILKPDYVEIQVIDTGVGISPENLAKLFQVGQHVSTTGTAEEKGTGLGLIMCQEMVHKHGGRMGVESEMGRGSRFWFSLPAVEPLPEGDWLAAVEVEPVTPVAMQRYTVPSRERLMELQALAISGDLYKVEAWLQAEGEAYPEFCEQVLQLVDMFDWAGVTELVNPYLSE